MKDPVIRAVPAVTRAIRILRLLEKSPEPLTVSEISAALELVPSTCLHILRALVEDDLVSTHRGTRRYTLGTGLLVLAKDFLDKDDFGRAAKPALQDIAGEFGVTTCATELVRNDHFTVVAAVGGTDFASMRIVVGSSFPMMLGAAGRCVAASSDWSDAESSRRFKGIKWQSAPGQKQWLADVAETRRQGFAIDDGNATAGVVVVSVPLLSAPGQIYGCITAVGVREQLSGRRLKELAARMMRKARAVAERTGMRMLTGPDVAA
ncbi:MAG: IclR family transcriptional regulator [Lautropia sp.]